MSEQQLERSCRKIERNRLTEVTEHLVNGLRHNRSREFIITDMEIADDFWREGLELSGCTTDVDVTKTVSMLKVAVHKLVI